MPPDRFACLVRSALPGLLLLVSLSAACNRVSAADTPEARVREADRRAVAELSEGGFAEARGWLSRADNRIFEGDPRRVQELVDSLYAGGARNLWFTRIEDFGGARVSGSLLVELPEDPVLREALLRRKASFEKRQDPAPDDGRRYFSLRF